jgi:hypothetical protein
LMWEALIWRRVAVDKKTIITTFECFDLVIVTC